MPRGEQKFGILQIELTPMCERKYATFTTEAAIPVCGILGRSLEKTLQECATEKYFKAVSFQECAASLPCGSIFLPLSWLFVSSARLEVKVLRFDGCVGYAQPIHTHNFAPLPFRPCMVKLRMSGGGV